MSKGATPTPISHLTPIELSSSSEDNISLLHHWIHRLAASTSIRQEETSHDEAPATPAFQAGSSSNFWIDDENDGKDVELDATLLDELDDIIHLSPIDASPIRTIFQESKEAHAPSSSTNPSSLDLPLWVDESHPHFFNFRDYLAEHPDMRPPREYRPAQPSEFEVSSNRSRSYVSEDYVCGLRLRYRIPQDVHFYASRCDEWVYQADRH